MLCVLLRGWLIEWKGSIFESASSRRSVDPLDELARLKDRDVPA